MSDEKPTNNWKKIIKEALNYRHPKLTEEEILELCRDSPDDCRED